MISQEEVRLRPYCDGDIPRLADIANDARIARNMRDIFPHPYSFDDARAFIRNVALPNAHSMFAVEARGELVGGAGIVHGDDVHRRQVEIGFWLGVAYWGQGIATRVARELVRRSSQRKGIVRIHARVFAWNRASARVLEKAGLAHEATLRASISKGDELTDELVYALVLEESART
jgi:[ribosomal protein S5]-alanine N-acetyltransferase